jgi:formylglycine-generating enzyme required for sulfatase activity
MNENATSEHPGEEKNTISDSKIRAGNNVHIGDNIIQNTIVAKGGAVRTYRIVLSVLSFTTLVLLCLIVYYFRAKEQKTEAGSTAQQKGLTESPKTIHTPNPVNKSDVVSTSTAQHKEQQTLHPVAGDPKISTIAREDGKSFIKGPVLKIHGNDHIKPFFINKFEVTIAQYFTFCKNTGREFPHNLVDTLRPKYPMTNITWQDASDYCHYAGGRLPLYEEWALSVRQALERDSIDEETILTISWNRQNSQGKVHPIGQKHVFSGAQLFDILGNVEEWCADGPKEGLKYTAGGYYKSLPGNMGLIQKSFSRAAFGSEVVGFRVVY